MRLALKVLLVCLLLQTFPAAKGQGHDPRTSKNSSSSSNHLGASGAIYRQLGALYKRVKETKSMYRALHAQAATPCSGGQQGVLCAANAADLELQDVLLMAGSPAVFDARIDSFFTNPISPPGDQGKCNSCVGFAVAAAAEAAVANARAIKGSDVTLSAQDLQFCAVDDKGNVKPARGCPSPWNLRDGLERLRTQPPVPASCLPYHAPHIEDKTLCSYCEQQEKNDRDASQGSFTPVALTSFADVQQAIRESGGVATAMYVNIAHMRGFFAAKPKGIYTGSPASMVTQGHAVFVVGYSNLDNFWLVKNSFGTGFADGGFMRVAYNTSGIMPADETFKVIFTPKTPQTRQLRVAADPKNRTGCFQYTAQPKDYMARVARAAGVSIQQFLLDNTGVVKDLDKPITGLQLRVCNPAPNTIVPPDDSSAALMMATSPWSYSSINPKQVGSVQLVATPQDQGPCLTVVAFAVAAAAETAMAAVLRVPVQDCSISAQSLYFCPVSGPTRSCYSGRSIPGTLSELERRSSSLPTADCLPYKPDFKSEMTRAELCKGPCTATNKYAKQGSFTSRQINSMWEAQRHIRQYGAVVTSFEVYSDFRPFFTNKSNSAAVYNTSADAWFQFFHAVVLVGYNNDEQYWIAKNSWGPDWGDGGFFKVAFGVCSVLTGTGQVYGIIWTPNQPVPATQLPVTSATPQHPECFWYKAGPTDYLSRVAWLAGIPLDQFMLDNTGIVKDLGAPLTDQQLLLCKPKPGTIKLI